MARLRQSRSPVAHGDPTRVYYCYEIYTTLPSGQRRTLYIGKGKNDRMYQHERIYRRKLKKAHPNLDLKEKLFLFVEDMGCTLYTAVFASGLSEDEAFNREHDEIMRVGLENLGNVAYPHRPRLLK